jgi:hypothetical protein
MRTDTANLRFPPLALLRYPPGEYTQYWAQTDPDPNNNIHLHMSMRLCIGMSMLWVAPAPLYTGIAPLSASVDQLELDRL